MKDEQIKKLKQKVGELVLDNDILKEASKGRPFGSDVRRVRASLPRVSERRACRVLGVARRAPIRSRASQSAGGPVLDEVLTERVRRLIAEYPTFGYRRLWALLRFRDGLLINRKAVYRVLEVKGWFVNQRPSTPRPRVQGSISRAARSNERWAMDVTHIDCGDDGWAHLAAVIDCHDREIIGYELALRARANEAERALEGACIERFGTLRPDGPTPVVRSDNGLIFQSRRFRAACRDYRLRQEFITPYTPQQNGIVERFFRSLKEECVWLRNFASFGEARIAVTQWLAWYNELRPHQALGYRSPRQFRAQQTQLVA